MLDQLIQERLHNAVYQLLESEWRSNLAKDLEHMGVDDGSAPLGKKTNNKKSST